MSAATDQASIDQSTASPEWRRTHCPACGRKFGKRTVCTIAAWFTWGTPTDNDIVHWACRFVRLPIAGRRRQPKPQRKGA